MKRLHGRTSIIQNLQRALLGLLLCLSAATSWATNSGDFVTTQSLVWVDDSGQASIAQVAALPESALLKLDQPRAFATDRGALWVRFQPPALDRARTWFLVLDGAAFTDRVTFFRQGADAQWVQLEAGDRVPISQWPHPDRMPVFSLDLSLNSPVWLRLENRTSPVSPSLQILDSQHLGANRDRSLLLLGGYLGFGTLVLFLGWVHMRLYRDLVFVAYVSYVVCMLGFQLAFTGLGGLMFWPNSPVWNDATPAIFMLWLTASGIWFVREVGAVQRHNRGLYRFMTAWCVLGLVYPAVYFAFLSPIAFKFLNLYGLLSVLLSMGVCAWAWKKGEVYAGWTALGFLPLHLTYPFPALRSAGVLPDSWATQYAILIGSAIEIPLLLYILHQRAKDFNENRARMRVIDSTDPLTGLVIVPVLLLRLAHTLRRARHTQSECALVLVELANHPEIVATEGREMGDRALVVAASQLSSLVRDVDTVCRVSDTRFAILLEASYSHTQLKLLPQHIIATGLAGAARFPLPLAPRFRVVTLALPDRTGAIPTTEELDVPLLLARLHRALDRLPPSKTVLSLPLPASAYGPGEHSSPST